MSEDVNASVIARLREAVLGDEPDEVLRELVLLAVVAEEAPSPIRAHRESLMFHAALREMGAMHDRKQTDYGKDQDPFANVRSSEEWGIPGWVGAMVRANDKVHRLKRFAEKGSLANEGVEDSLIDIAVYSIIALCLYREESAAAEAARLVLDEETTTAIAEAVVKADQRKRFLHPAGWDSTTNDAICERCHVAKGHHTLIDGLPGACPSDEAWQAASRADGPWRSEFGPR